MNCLVLGKVPSNLINLTYSILNYFTFKGRKWVYIIIKILRKKHNWLIKTYLSDTVISDSMYLQIQKCENNMKKWKKIIIAFS